ncbi:hypothetical protein IAT40_004711 [Kwoniella sp. CBS 6097]
MLSNHIDRPLVNHLVCIVGAYVGSRYALRTYMAIWSLATHARKSPSFPIVKSDSSSETTTEGSERPHTRPWWRKMFSQDGALFMTILLSILAIQMFLVVILPRITPKLVLDVFWASMISYLVAGKISQVIQTLYPAPIARKLQHNKEPNRYQSEIIPLTDVSTPLLANKRLRQVVSILLTATIMGHAYMGVEGLTLAPLVAAGFVIEMAGHTFYPKVTIRRGVQVVMGVLTFGAAAGLFIGPIINLFKKDKPSAEDEPKKEPPQTISMWIADVAMMFNVGMGMMLPSALLSITLRYEYMRSSARQLLPVDEEHKVIVPTSVSKFEKPIFKTGLITLVLGTLIHDLIVPKFIEINEVNRNIMTIFSAAPFALVGLMGAAWYTEQFKNWWLYYDEWYPEPPQSDQDESGPIIDEEQTVAFADHDEKVVNDLVQLDDEKKEGA